MGEAVVEALNLFGPGYRVGCVSHLLPAVSQQTLPLGSHVDVENRGPVRILLQVCRMSVLVGRQQSDESEHHTRYHHGAWHGPTPLEPAGHGYHEEQLRQIRASPGDYGSFQIEGEIEQDDAERPLGGAKGTAQQRDRHAIGQELREEEIHHRSSGEHPAQTLLIGELAELVEEPSSEHRECCGYLEKAHFTEIYVLRAPPPGTDAPPDGTHPETQDREEQRLGEGILRDEPAVRQARDLRQDECQEDDRCQERVLEEASTLGQAVHDHAQRQDRQDEQEGPTHLRTSPSSLPISSVDDGRGFGPDMPPSPLFTPRTFH